MTILYEDDIMTIGKYADMPIADIINIDPTYIKTFNNSKDSRNVAISDEVINNIVDPSKPKGSHVSDAVRKIRAYKNFI